MAQKKVKRPKRPKGSPPLPRKDPPIVPIAILVVGSVLLLSSMALPWGTLSVKTNLGPIPVTLDAKVYEYGVSYEADLSGTGGLIQGSSNINRKISESRVFLTGLGAFQETIGFIKGSSKYRNHTIEMYTVPENNRAKTAVETYAATIPWWPVGLPQEVRVTVRIIDQPVNITHVEIKKVWVELHQQVNGADRYKVLWESTPGDKLKAKDDEKVYTTKILVDSDLGNFSIVGRATMELIDKNGKSNLGHELRSFSEQEGPKMIDLWTISNDKTVRIGLLLTSMPLTVLSVVLMLATSIPAFKRKNWAWKVATAGAIIGLLSAIFYVMGVGALIELTGYGEWFNWNPAGLALAFIGAAIGLVGSTMLFMQLRQGPRSKPTSDTGPEDEAETKAVRKPKSKKVPTPTKEAG